MEIPNKNERLKFKPIFVNYLHHPYKNDYQQLFKPVKLCLKIGFASYPARVEGLGKYDQQLMILLGITWHHNNISLLMPPRSSYCNIVMNFYFGN